MHLNLDSVALQNEQESAEKQKMEDPKKGSAEK